MRSFAAARPVAIGVLAIAVVISGCSSKKKTATSGATSAAPATSGAVATSAAPASGAASGSAAPALKGDPASVALLTQSLASLSKVKSVHLKGNFAQGSVAGSVDLSFANGVGATGSIGLGGGTVKFIAVGKDVYIQGDAKSFAAFGGGADLGALGGIAGKWLKLSSDSAGSIGTFSVFSDLSSFASQIADVTGTVGPGGKKTINGKAAIGVIDNAQDPSNSATIYVAASSDHLPLQVVPLSGAGGSAGPTTGEINFLDYNAAVSVVAPPGAIDISQLASLAASPTG